MMSEEKKERKLPIRSLHEFLFEISEAWDGFRTGSLITMIVSTLLILLLTPRLIVLHFRRGDFIESVIYLAIIIGLSFNLLNSWKQHQFYKKWERRIGVLMHEEDELLGDEQKQ
jgi:hypothetical protein